MEELLLKAKKLVNTCALEATITSQQQELYVTFIELINKLKDKIEKLEEEKDKRGPRGKGST